MKIAHTGFFITMEEFVFGIAFTHNEEFFSIQILCFVLAFFFDLEGGEQE